MDDDLLKEFVNESREHLATIEADLLTIEEAGANVDSDLVNKVFRAAHSIKGGSGFFGLNNVKELAHKAETVLDMIRSKKMAPNAEITNLLLASFDRLREMINNPGSQADIDNSDLLTSLIALASSYLPAGQKETVAREITLTPPGALAPITMPLDVFERIKRSVQFMYEVKYDLIHDIEKQGKNVLAIFRDLDATGEIVECALDFAAVGTLDGPVGNTLPLRLIYATVMDPGLAEELFSIPRERVALLFKPSDLAAVKAPGAPPEPPKAAPAPVTAPSTTPIPAAPETTVPVPVEKAADTMPPPSSAPPPDVKKPKADAAAADDTLRVNVQLLENLMNLAGELVLSRNQLRSAISQNNMRALTLADQRLNLVTSELQEAVMRTRLQPIGNVFSKFPRVVRDMSASLKKDIVLDIVGKDVALDRSLIEGLSDPLTHMVRNSVDHGIEMPADRVKAGKKPQGTVRLEARHEAGQVVVEIADDGKGIDPEKVAKAAVNKGLIAAEKLKGMSDQDKLALILLPGLSTAEKVTDVSGRGVGMDVAKTNLDRLGGKMEIHSEIGKGSRFVIKLPLTLAIIPSLIISIENERFAIPQINVEELLRIRPEEVKKRIEVVGDAEVLLLRDSIIPLVRFNELLGILPTYIDPKTGKREIDRRKRLADRRSPRYEVDSAEPDSIPAGADGKPLHRRRTDGRRASAISALEIVVLTTGTLKFGLVVGAFHNTEEIVVKPLGRHIKHLREYAGATILGDGTVVLILDIAGIGAKAELAAVSGSARAREKVMEADAARLEDTHSLLMFRNTPEEFCAIPLGTVRRVERISHEQVDNAGGKRTLRYRGTSLPLVTLADVAQVKQLDENSEYVVIVSRVHGREIGLLGAMPVDVMEHKAEIDQTTHRQKGIAGSTIINEHTTLVVDLPEIADTMYPEWIPKPPAAAATRAKDSPAGDTQTAPQLAAAAMKTGILLAEDSDFFRGQIKRAIEDGGYEVFDAPDGEAAWEVLLKNLDRIQIVVTDIEMPRLTGLELSARIRGDERTAALPIIAVTSLAGEDDAVKGRKMGINDYQVKMDRDKLLASIAGFAKGV